MEVLGISVARSYQVGRNLGVPLMAGCSSSDETLVEELAEIEA